MTNKLRLFLSENGKNYSSISLPVKIKKITLLKAPHVFKKAKDQFEIRTYNKLICCRSTVKALPIIFLLIPELSLVGGISLKVSVITH